MMYELKVPNGTYKADNLFRLFFVVFQHRLKHLIKDGKFMDQEKNMFAVFLILIPVLFMIDHKDFFDKVAIDRAKGAKWHYVGKSALDPTAKSIPLQCMIYEEGKESVPCGEPYIYYKLKKQDD